jgi:hypothetical protein
LRGREANTPSLRGREANTPSLRGREANTPSLRGREAAVAIQNRPHKLPNRWTVNLGHWKTIKTLWHVGAGFRIATLAVDGSQ